MSDIKRPPGDDAEDLSPAEREMEAALARLLPLRPAFAADSVLAECVRRAQPAGRAARRQAMVWRIVAGGLAASLAIVLWMRRPAPPAERVVIRIVHDQVPSSGPAGQPSAASDERQPSVPEAYLVLREQVMKHGVAILPPMHAVRSADTHVYSPPDSLSAPRSEPGPLIRLIQPFTRTFITGERT